MQLGIHDILFQKLLINTLYMFVFNLNCKLFILQVLLNLRRMTIDVAINYKVSKSVVIDYIELILKN